MHWADKIAKEIVDSGKFKPYWVDDMKTPSGFAHVGSLRGPLIHSVIYRALKSANQKAKFTFVFNDFDVADELPSEFKEKLIQYMGFPLREIPSPVDGFKSLGAYLVNDLKETLEKLGVEAKYLSSYDMYKAGKFDGVIREALDNGEKIQDIYEKVSGSKKRQQGWLPFQVVCEKCGKLGTTKVFAWDGKEVSYKCEPDLVTWAKGCGYEGKISPFGGTGKLPWKVDWPAHWKVIGITIEGAGKDHASAGGSYDIAMEMVKDVFKYPQPYKYPYEFILIGGRKMSSSKGVGLKAHDIVKILPPEVARFLFTRTNPKEQINFDPLGSMAIPDLFDEYDSCWQAYINGSNENLARAFEMAQVKDVPKKEPVLLPRFRDVGNMLVQGKKDLPGKFEPKVLEERIKYAKIWLEKYAPDDFNLSMSDEIPEEAKKLDKEQKEYLAKVIGLVEKINNEIGLQTAVYNLAKELKIDIKKAFAAIYLSFIGKDHGPRVGQFLLQYPKDKVIERLKSVVSTGSVSKNNVMVKIEKSNGYAISDEVKEKFPGVSFAYTVIRGVNIKRTDPRLEVLKKEYVEKLRKNLDIEKIGQIKSIRTYRQMLRETGIDYHSHRPSPDALLRRVVQGKDLYSINTAVDAYNLAVLETSIGLGGFDLKYIKEPVILRFSEDGEEMHLLGDKGVSKTEVDELVYSDAEKVLTLDLNYRDIDQTKITSETKDIILFADGGQGIDSKDVKKVLQLGTDYIIRYCGGKADEIILIQ